MQVLVAVARRQRVEYLLEQVDAVTDARMNLRTYVYRMYRLLCVIGGKRSLKMNPVNRPRRIGACSVGVRNSGGEYEILVGGDGVLAFVDAEPSRPVDAVNENILIDGLFPFPKVVKGFGIIADVRNVEHGNQRIFFHHPDNELGQNDCPLSVETVFQSYHNI